MTKNNRAVRALGAAAGDLAVIVAVLCASSCALDAKALHAQDVTRSQAPLFVGPAGLAGTWRVIRAASAPATLCEESPPACPVTEAVVSEDGVLRLDELTGAPATVSLAMRLEARMPARIHVFLGGSGHFSAWLDGRELARGASAELRSDDVLAPLELTAGAHVLVVRTERPAQGSWRVQARILDADLAAGFGANVTASLGTLDDSLAASLALRSVRMRESRAAATGDGRLVLEVALDRPAGGVRWPITASLGTESAVLDVPRKFDVPAPPRGDLRAALVLAASAQTQRTVPVGQALALDRPVAAALRVLRGALSAPTAPATATTSAPLAWRAEELARILRERDPDVLWRRTLIADARRLAADLARGRDPLVSATGYVRMAIRSRLDGKLVPYELFVPPAHARGTRTFSLLVTLHGFSGNAGDYFRNTFGLARDPRATLDGHGRNGEAPTTGPMIVVAPTGRGQTHYRYAGEEDVLEVLADVRARYRVDDARMYVTGGSMGGTGAAYLPFRHPDLFAASAALAGYHDQRVRQDTAQAALAPWETFLRAERSDVDWAENALHLPMLLVRGTHDLPLAWTTSLATRLGLLHYRYEHREPESGHNVWTETYADGALFRWLAPYRRPAAPPHVRFRTARARHASAWWVKGVQREHGDAFGDVDATLSDASGTRLVRGTTQNVGRLTLSPGTPGERVRAELDGDVIEGTSPLALSHEAGHWRAPRAPATPEIGPIRDVFHDPLLFVVGTADPRHTLINRLVARAWAEPRGWQVSYPVIDDVAVTDEQLRTHTVVLVGPPSSNRVLARFAGGLAVRFDRDAIVVDGVSHRGREVGAVFVAQSPFTAPSPQRFLVIAGLTPLGTWRSTFLPDLLPDLVVFDEHIAAARERFAVGGTGASLRAAVFYPIAPTQPLKLLHSGLRLVEAPPAPSIDGDALTALVAALEQHGLRHLLDAAVAAASGKRA